MRWAHITRVTTAQSIITKESKSAYVVTSGGSSLHQYPAAAASPIQIFQMKISDLKPHQYEAFYFPSTIRHVFQYLPAYDSVRGIFTEGEETYEGAAFQKKTHTQLCIVNPNCIKGYFKALNPVPDYPIP